MGMTRRDTQTSLQKNMYAYAYCVSVSSQYVNRILMTPSRVKVIDRTKWCVALEDRSCEPTLHQSM